MNQRTTTTLLGTLMVLAGLAATVGAQTIVMPAGMPRGPFAGALPPPEKFVSDLQGQLKSLEGFYPSRPELGRRDMLDMVFALQRRVLSPARGESLAAGLAFMDVLAHPEGAAGLKAYVAKGEPIAAAEVSAGIDRWMKAIETHSGARYAVAQGLAEARADLKANLSDPLSADATLRSLFDGSAAEAASASAPEAPAGGGHGSGYGGLKPYDPASPDSWRQGAVIDGNVVRRAVSSPDGKRVAVVFEGTLSLQLFDAASGRRLRAHSLAGPAKRDGRGRRGNFNSKIEWSADGKAVAVLSDEMNGGVLSVVDADTGELLSFLGDTRTGRTKVESLAFNPKKPELLAVSFSDGSAAVVDTRRAGKAVWSARGDRTHSAFHVGAWDPAGRMLDLERWVSAETPSQQDFDYPFEVSILDLSEGRLVKTFGASFRRYSSGGWPYSAFFRSDWRPDGALIVSRSDGGRSWIFDPATWKGLPLEVYASWRLSDGERYWSARRLLGRALHGVENGALRAAHEAGKGELGDNGFAAGPGNFTAAQSAKKRALLRDAGFTDDETALLLDAGLI